MSVNFTLKPVTYDGDASTEGMPAGLVYLNASLEASDEQYSGFVSGWIRPEAHALVKAAPELLAVLEPLVYWHDQDTAIDESWWEAARAAIAQARGVA